MTAQIGSFSFDAMRGRLNPDEPPTEVNGRVLQMGIGVPTAGEIETDILLADLATAVTESASYRAAIGSVVSANINGSSITSVLISDCRTSVSVSRPSCVLTAKWKLVAYADWEP